MRQAFPGFSSPPSAEELAGLACEPELESRLVLERDGEHPWQVLHGPFDDSDFENLPESHWTLLVQDVDKFIPEVADLLSAFRFLPDWRIDDVMVSYAADQGSVGPHMDDYDVFLVQAQGHRRWRIDPEPAANAAYVPNLDLRILQQFNARADYLMRPGDVLYLPPGVPHWGIAEGPCITWSVGFRAASWREMATSWCDYAAEQNQPEGRYRDRELGPDKDPFEIRPEVFEQVRQTLEQGVAGCPEPLFREWLGRFLTEPKEHLQVFPVNDPLSSSGLGSMLVDGKALVRNSFSRFAWCGSGYGEDLLFTNGNAHSVASEHRAFISLLAREREIAPGELAPWLRRPDCLALLCELYNEGHYELGS